MAVKLLLVILAHGVALVGLLAIEVDTHVLIEINLTICLIGVRLDDLNVTVAWQKFHIGRTV